MTRDPRADELLREALMFMDDDAPYQTPGAHEWAWVNLTERIRAHLDEPQGEPEYVWRVTAPIETRPVLLDHHPVRREWQAKITRIERAPVGPWEVVTQ